MKISRLRDRTASTLQRETTAYKCRQESLSSSVLSETAKVKDLGTASTSSP